MDSDAEHTPLRRDRLFRGSLAATLVAITGCLAMHILTLVGVVAAVAWFSAIEHALVVAVIAGAVLTIYAFVRHRRCGHKQA